ncbi:hypothetical protein OAF34_04145 [Pirellulaceae bacterium]|nr:hypothetical protein [Pirellulaceae bacterium]
MAQRTALLTSVESDIPPWSRMNEFDLRLEVLSGKRFKPSEKPGFHRFSLFST